MSQQTQPAQSSVVAEVSQMVHEAAERIPCAVLSGRQAEGVLQRGLRDLVDSAVVEMSA